MNAVLGSGGSEFNRLPEVREALAFPDDVFVVDSTIRSLQSGVSGSLHSADDLVTIGMGLDTLGVRELIVNISWRDGPAVVRDLAKRRPKASIVATFRARNERAPEWADLSMDCGADDICFESPPDPAFIEQWSRHIQKRGRRVSWAFAERYSYGEIVELARSATAARAASLSYHDSFFELGITPEAIRHFIRSVVRDVPGHPPIYVHLSNFYGHATMTGVAALTAGANAVDVCMNATGHHCGHTSLAEVVMVLEDLYGIRTDIDLGRITEVAQLVSAHSRVPLPLTMPVIGDYAFMGDGAYWAAEEHLLNEERVHARFPFAPEIVGAVERIVWSDRTATPDAIRARLRSIGLSDTPTLAAAVHKELGRVLRAKRDYPGWLTDAEFSELCGGVAGRNADSEPIMLRPTGGGS
jgi:hypothetical protein